MLVQYPAHDEVLVVILLWNVVVQTLLFCLEKKDVHLAMVMIVMMMAVTFSLLPVVVFVAAMDKKMVMLTILKDNPAL
eukprot:8026146-Ditylum_brightwellii.AAC.1